MQDFFTPKQPRFVLVVGDDGALLVPVGGAEPEDALFAAAHDDVARKALQKRLAQSPAAPVTVLANGAAQEFRVETLPPLNFLDRGKLVRRRLRQSFLQAFATASRNLDRTHVLLACLHQSSAVAGWLGFMGHRNVRVGLLPVEGAALVTQLLPEAETGWALLVANFRTGGLRQIVTYDGQVVFTRQTPSLSAVAPQNVAETLARVIEDSRSYLARFGLTQREDLRIILLLGRAHLTALRNPAEAEPMTFLTPRQAAEKLGLDFLPEAESGDSDLVFAGWMAARRRLWMPLLPPAMKQQQQSAALARYGWRVALILCVLALVTTGGNARRLAVQLYDNNRNAAEVSALRARLVAQEGALAPAAQPLGRLRAALERQRLFADPETGPSDVLQQLRQELNGQARVTRLEWRDDGTLRIDLRLEEGGDPHVADRDAIVARFKALADQLAQRMPNYVIEVTRYPFPALPQEVLSNIGNEVNSSADVPTAGLTIRRRS